MQLLKTLAAVAWSASLMSCGSAMSISTTPTKQELISAANQAKENMLTFYNGDRPGGIPGYMLRPDVYYWWQVGGMVGQLIQHWQLTGNATYNQLVTDALLWQSKDNLWFQPSNQTNSEGNDDQAFWAYAALDAAEYNFPAPPSSLGTSWLGLAQAVFNAQVPRWDDTKCSGGLKWQIYYWNPGWDYKNVPSNGGLFQLAARLARYTGNQTYIDWAEKTWQWMENTKLIDGRNRPDALHIYDGINDLQCPAGIEKVEYTYNPGALIMGAAYMYNYTNGNSTWLTRITNLVNGLFDDQYLVGQLGPNPTSSTPFFNGSILSESAIEFQTPENSNDDEPSFKAYTLRWLAVASQLCPQIAQNVSRIFIDSAQGAALQCVGKAPGAGGNTPSGLTLATPGTGNNWCGRRWYQTTWDGWSGFGEQMSAMSVFQNYLIIDGGIAPPLTPLTGANSTSQPSVGGNANSLQAQSPTLPSINTQPITAADTAGASILTALSIILLCGMTWFMIF